MGMKNLRMFLFFVFLLEGSFTFASGYWISFTTFDSIFLMKVTDSGVVLIPPTAVNESLKTVTGTAITPAGSQIGLWAIVEIRTSPPDTPPNAPVYRILVDKETLSASSARRFIALAGGTGLSASQNAGGAFLAYQSGIGWSLGRRLRGFGLTSDRKWNGRSFRLAPASEGCFLQGGVSADGRISWSAPCAGWWNSLPSFNLQLQPLREDGTAAGAPSVAAAVGVQYADISNPLPDGKRLVAYFSINPNNPRNDPSLFVQSVNATTGRKLTSRKLIDSKVTSDTLYFGSLAMDPDGHFLIYSAKDPACSTNRILFQGLDASGNKSGAPLTLVDCRMDPASATGPMGLDIWKESE